MSVYYKLILILVLVPVFVLAGTFGSKNLLHVQTASTLDPGRLDLRTNLRFYTKVAEYLGQNKPEDFSSYNLWVVQSNMLLTYGIMENFDITVMSRIYQDLNNPKKEYNSPEDIYIDLKVGSFGLSNNRFHVGFLGKVRIPTQGANYNYAFEPYTAGGFEYGLMGLFSFYNDPYLHDRSFSIHANLGWYNHNDAGKTLWEYPNRKIVAEGNATELQYGLGFAYPTELFNLNLELWGNSFISSPKPAEYIYSTDNYIYFTPSIKFKPRTWMSFDLGLDIRLSSVSKDFPLETLNLPMYPSWRMYMGLNFTLMPISGKGKAAGGKTVQSKVDFFESLLRERQRSRSIEEELRRLKREREQAEKELEELRQMLEEQGKK